MFAPNYDPRAGFGERPWPTLRNAVVGYLEQCRPHLCWGHGEVDVTPALERIREIQRELRIAISFHAFALHALSRAAVAHPGVLTYRHGRKLVTFSEADVCTTIDRRVAGHRIAVAYCVRGAQRKSAAAINWELRAAMSQVVPPDPAIHLRRRFAKLPGFARHLVNGMMTRNPHWLRRVYGTIGLTNLQSHGLNRPFWALPPGVCTLTLSLGTIVDRVALDSVGRAVNRKHLCLAAGADHAVLDGMAMSRFAYAYIQALESAAALDDAFVAETRAYLAAERATPPCAAVEEVLA